ncbi:chondroadherin-like [Sitophilus oryzae]|uniref:Chondroadherin-like n=1 Tax=Sitophilus oryzae TaxID=7048 RepID=A0A6J2YPB6_SITOR|nr:chondroadherin-like [Sitophilus oryzae]
MILKYVFFLFFVSKIAAIDTEVFEFDLLWYESNSTQPYLYKARSEITEGLRKSEKIQLNTSLESLSAVDLTFIPELKVLSLDNISLTYIKPGAFNNLPKTLQNLSITLNKIPQLDEGVFNNLTVRFLNLSHNQIRTIKSEAFDNMKDLTTIILDHNELSQYDLKFAGCQKLNHISIKNNFIEQLPANLFAAVSDNVMMVEFSYNKLNKIHKLAFDIKEFKEVYLDHNELTDAVVLIKLVKADKVNLSHNNINCLPKEFMENGLSKIKALNLIGNPLNCSCLHDLRKKVRKNIEFQKMSPLVKNINITLPEKDCVK